MTTQQPAALRLADDLGYVAKYSDSEHWGTLDYAATELRRLHAEVAQWRMVFKEAKPHEAGNAWIALNAEVERLRTQGEPVAKVQCQQCGHIIAKITQPLYTTPPNHLAVMRQALEALKLALPDLHGVWEIKATAAIIALREQLGETK